MNYQDFTTKLAIALGAASLPFASAADAKSFGGGSFSRPSYSRPSYSQPSRPTQSTPTKPAPSKPSSGGNGGNNHNGGSNGGGNGHSNNPPKRTPIANHSAVTRGSAESLFSLRNIILFNMLFSHNHSHATSYYANNNTSLGRVDMNCAVRELKEYPKFAALPRVKLEDMVIEGKTPEARKAAKDCMAPRR